MRFLVIGCGSIGKRHAKNLLDLGHDVVAYNRGDERREEAHRLLGIKVYSDIEEMLTFEQADAACICSPNNMHAKHALAAVRHGLHLFVEKPAADSLSDLDELVDEVNKQHLISHVGANMRFHFGPAKVKQYIDTGQIGRPLWAHFWGGMHLPDWHPDEDYRLMYSAKINMGGGVVLDFIHELDLVRWMFGDPTRIAAMTSQSGWLEIETEDVADVLLGYQAGLQVNVHLDYLQRPFQRGIRVVGNKGWVEWDLARQHIEWFDHASRQAESSPYPDTYDHNDMYVEQMKYFVKCIENGIRSDSDLMAGSKALELALQIKKSSVTEKFIKGGCLC